MALLRARADRSKLEGLPEVAGAQVQGEGFTECLTTRASLALYNDDADVDALLSGLDEAARRLK